MKNYFKYFLIIGFVVFSFYYTDKVTKISEQNNVIMASINDYALKHDSKCIEGSITEDGVILGLSGISVNKNKSYSNMKGIGFNEKLIEYNKDECILSINNNYDKYIVRDILNRNIVKKFEEGKDFTILPKIEIYLFLDLDCDNNYDYYGEIKINNEKIEDFGIKFTCQFNDEFRDDLMTAILDRKIPYDYYEMSWETFKGKPYNLLKKPLRYLSIDNSKSDGNNTYMPS